MHGYADVDMISDADVARARVKREAIVSMPISLAQTIVSLINYYISQPSCQNTGLREDTRRVGKSQLSIMCIKRRVACYLWVVHVRCNTKALNGMRI